MSPVSYLVFFLIILLAIHQIHGSQSEDLDAILIKIDHLTSGNTGKLCLSQNTVKVPLQLDTSRFLNASRIADIMSNVISAMASYDNIKLIENTLRPILSTHRLLKTVRLVERYSRNGTARTSTSTTSTKLTATGKLLGIFEATNDGLKVLNANDLPANLHQEGWFPNSQLRMKTRSELQERGDWTFPYFICSHRRWLIAYTVYIAPSPLQTASRSGSFLSLEFDLTTMDIDQCDTDGLYNSKVTNSVSITELQGTHKCHNISSQCAPIVGRMWRRGSYRCQCKPGYFSPLQESFIGTNLEVAYDERTGTSSDNYSLYTCQPCPEGCDTCTTDEPCMAKYRWALRGVFLAVSLVCVAATFALVFVIIHYRRLKVVKTGSPIFLVLTLIGCAVMYSEMAAIYPILDVHSCVVTKWTRHMGFCITYSALLLKTWRVSLTYRVKSAHKLKLTDRQLIQWLFPIILIMVIYLTSWTVSDPPHAVEVTDGDGLKYLQCDFGWWDHCLAAGEIVFLCWGIRVCFSVRNAPSLFNEAKYISWSIYNIAIVNGIMAVVHLLVTSGPDIKYFLGLLRTQLSTTTTIALVFFPKLLRISRGLGDEYDKSVHYRTTTACIDPVAVEDEIDIYQENEELKEEIQKLAAQVEFIKIVGMQTDNRHLKSRRDGYFSDLARRKSSIGAVLRLDESCNV